MLDLAILGLLEERGPLHGYEIRKQLRDGLGFLANVSYGSLYPALARLEASGAVVAVEGGDHERRDTVEPVPLTGSLSGEWAVLRARRHAPGRARGRRARKAYRITAVGRRLFAELLNGGGVADDARSFGLRLAFARHLPPHARMSLLERRRHQLTERLAGLRQADDASLDVYARSVVEHTADAIGNDLGWLDRLIAAERRDDSTTSGVGEPEPRVAGAENLQ